MSGFEYNASFRDAKVSMIHTHIYKSWIKNNPDLAIKHVERIFNEAEKNGMKIFRYFEDANYVDIVAAHKESAIPLEFC